MSNDLFLSNFKISTKLESISLHHIEELCLNKDIAYKKFSNFICFKIYRRKKRCRKDPKKFEHFSYSIWKKAECLKNNASISSHNDKNHCNISKVEEKKEIGKSFRKLQRFLKIPLKKPDYSIDNITATIKTGHKINLKKFEKINRYKENITYNPESFPGLVVRKNKLTYIIFTSGSINIVGGKSRKQILKGIPWIKKVVPKLETENESGFESESESESDLELAYNVSESEFESELELACKFSKYATSKNNRAKLSSLKSG